MRIQHLVDFLAVFFKNKSVFLAVYVIFKLGKIGQQIARIFVLRRRRYIFADFPDFLYQVVTPLF